MIDDERFYRQFDEALARGADLDELWQALNFNAMKSLEWVLEHHLAVLATFVDQYPGMNENAQSSGDERHLRQILHVVKGEARRRIEQSHEPR